MLVLCGQVTSAKTCNNYQYRAVSPSHQVAFLVSRTSSLVVDRAVVSMLKLASAETLVSLLSVSETFLMSPTAWGSLFADFMPTLAVLEPWGTDSVILGAAPVA